MVEPGLPEGEDFDDYQDLVEDFEAVTPSVFGFY